jgi:hypothetical protein
MATLTAAGVNFSDGTTINGTSNNNIGFYCWAAYSVNNSTLYGPGTTVAGSSLRMSPVSSSNIPGNGGGYNPGYSGTYRACSYTYGVYDSCAGINYRSQGLWVRIS